MWKIQVKSGNNAKNIWTFKNKPSMPLAFIRNNKLRLLFGSTNFSLYNFFPLSFLLAAIATKLRLQGVSEFELSPGPPPFTVAAYVPGVKVSIACSEVSV